MGGFLFFDSCPTTRHCASGVATDVWLLLIIVIFSLRIGITNFYPKDCPASYPFVILQECKQAAILSYLRRTGSRSPNCVQIYREVSGNEEGIAIDVNYTVRRFFSPEIEVTARVEADADKLFFTFCHILKFL